MESPKHHKTLDERWGTLSLAEQMANIGSEVYRTAGWHKKGDVRAEKQSAERALELFDLTSNDRRWRSRLNEIIRLREVFCDIFFGKKTYNVTIEMLNKYFLQFALLSRKALYKA